MGGKLSHTQPTFNSMQSIQPHDNPKSVVLAQPREIVLEVTRQSGAKRQ